MRLFTSCFLLSTRSLLLLMLLVGVLTGCSKGEGGELEFDLRIVDADGPRNPWGKGVGDLNGDGFPDLVVGGNAPVSPVWWRRVLNVVGLAEYPWPEQGELVWYESPSHKKHLVSDQFRIRTDIEVADVDGDGRNDVIAVTDDGLVWFQSPDWVPHLIDNRLLHDLEVADFDRDGRLDIVARNQQLFDHNDGDRLDFYFQSEPDRWTHQYRGVPEGEGLKVADLDRDGLPDIVVNQVWYRNLGAGIAPDQWATIPYCPGWNWPHAYLEVHDFNLDGQPDIAMAPAEPVGDFFRLSWCELTPGVPPSSVEHVVDSRVETVMHSVLTGDFNLDGRPDLVTALMYQGQGGEEVSLYSQPVADGAWERQTIGRRGSHSMKAADFDLDGDLDLLGANWSGKYQPVEVWINSSQRRTAEGWRRHMIDPDMPWRSVFVLAGDLNGDRRVDIAAGGWWYANPGAADGAWRRRSIGQRANNVTLLEDWNGDGSLDILASTWNAPRQWGMYESFLDRTGIRPLQAPGGFVWARNDGKGAFSIQHNVESGHGDFLQGVAVLDEEGQRQIVLSWHVPSQGLQSLRLPEQVANGVWKIGTLSPVSQDEALSASDVDRDGRVDLVLGTRWLRNKGGGVWSPFTLHVSDDLPDRHVVVDLNRDGRPDVVIGYEAVGVPGVLAWYEQGAVATRNWQEHVIAQVVGPMSLSVADVDGDGDADVVVGEHQLSYPATARLLWFENRDGHGTQWVPHTIHTGDEHHDGALTVDIDGDGDLDILSIGWGHNQLLLYENLRATRQ